MRGALYALAVLGGAAVLLAVPPQELDWLWVGLVVTVVYFVAEVASR